MQSFFEWLSELDKSTQLVLFIFVAIGMVVIPYLSLIKRYILFFIKSQPLKIEYFVLESSPHVHIGKDSEGVDLYAEIAGDGIFIDGCSATLIWGVTGARNIDIHPVGKSLEGNAATVIINASHPEYILTAKGLSGKTLSATLRIPEEDLYRLDLAPLGDLAHTGNNRSLNTVPLTHSFPANRHFTRDQPLTGNRNNLIGPHISHLNPEPVALRNEKRRILHTALDKRKILTVYNYSTTKYNAIKHFFNETEADYSTTIKQ
jgi:hypothetical protein